MYIISHIYEKNVAARVIKLLRGKASTTSAAYRVEYDGSGSETDICEVNHLVDDFLAGDVEIIWCNPGN